MTLTGLLRFFEQILVVCVLLGMIVFFAHSIDTLAHLDWAESDTYFVLIRRVLALAIGVEIIRFIESNQIDTLLEILIFLLARQLLHMEIESDYSHLLVVVIGIAIFIGMRIVLEHLDKPQLKQKQ